MKLSQHSKLRMRQRTNFNHRERRSLFRDALTKGESPNNIKNEKVKNFLMSKKNCGIKLYKGYVFIYSKHSKQLYTMYELPDKLRGDNDEK